MARLNSVASWLANFGKSIGYSAKDVLTEVAPNTTKITEDAADEIYKLRDFMSDYRAKGKQVDRALNFTELQKQANDIIEGTINDIKTGNFATPKDDFGDLFGSDDLDFDSSDYTTSEDQNESGVEVRKLNLSTDAKATAKVSLEGSNRIAETLERSSKAQMMAQVNTAKVIMNTTNNIGMIAVNKLGASLTETNKRLDQINTNLVNIVKFMNDNQSKVNQAHLDYLKSAHAFMKVQMEMYKPSKKKGKTPALDAFLAGGSFDLPSYLSVVKENYENSSSLAQLQIMLGMGSMMGNMMGAVGGPGSMFRPTQILMNTAMKRLIPKKIQKAITKVDALLPQALMGGLSTLSDMRNEGGLKGIIGEIFGAGARRQNSFQLAKYNKGAVPWDGKSKRALEVVIPHYLALIESHTSNIKKTKSGHEADYYDYDTGTFKTKKQIRESLRTRTSDAFRGAVSESVDFFSEKFATDKDLQDKAKQIMWKHLQPMVYGEKTLEGEEDVTKAARAYGNELRRLGLNPYEVSQLVIQFKGSVTKLRQYMMNFELTGAESELYSHRETDSFGFVKGGFSPEDLGNILTDTDLSRKQLRDKEKAEKANDAIRKQAERAKGALFASKNEKNKRIENIKYAASEGTYGTLYARNKAASAVEAYGLGLINLISGYDTLDTSSGVKGAATSFVENSKKYSRDQLTVNDVIRIMRECGYNSNQYDFITADNSGEKDGPFGMAVLKYRYGKVGNLRIIYRRNIVLTEGKKYVIKAVDHKDRTVKATDKDADLNPVGGFDIYPVSTKDLPRDPKTQWEYDQQLIASEKPISKDDLIDDRSFLQRWRDRLSGVKDSVLTGSPTTDTDSNSSKSSKPKDEKQGNGNPRLGGAPSRRITRKPGSNTNEETSRRVAAKKVKKTSDESVRIAVDGLSKVTDSLEYTFTEGKAVAASIWSGIKRRVGLTKRTALRGGAGGLLGALLLPTGPIGGAIIGATVGIATTGYDFKKMIFGSKHVDENGVVHVEKTGMIGQWTNMLQTEGKGLLKSTFDSMKTEIAAYTKAQFSPVIAAFKDMGLDNPVTESMVETIQKVGRYVMDTITHPMQALNSGLVKITGAMLKATVKGGSIALKTGAKTAAWIAAKPAQLLADIWQSRKAANPYEALKNIRRARKSRSRAKWGARLDYLWNGLDGSLASGAKAAVTTRGNIFDRIGAFKTGMAENKESFYTGRYEDEKARIEDIRARMQSPDPMERQAAMEELLPKDRNGNVKDKAWNALPRDENGQINIDELDRYIGENYSKFLNTREQALVGLSDFAKYRVQVRKNKEKGKLDKVLSKYNRKDNYASKDLSDKEYAKRRKDVEQYLERDAEGNIIDETYNRIENKEDFDKWMKNQEAFKKELQERDRIAEEEKEKAAVQVTRKNQIALALGQISATLGIPLDESLIDTASDKTSAIITAVNTAIEQKKQKMQDQAEEEQKEEENKADIADAEHRRKTAAANEDKADAADARRREKAAQETAAIQVQGKDKVKDSTGEEDEEPGKAEPVEGGAVAQEEEKESWFGDILKKAELAIGGVATVAALLNSETGRKLIGTLGEVLGKAVISLGGKLAKGIGNAIMDGIKGIGDKVGDFFSQFVPGGDTKEFTKEEMEELNPDYVGAGTTVDENGNEVVTATVNTERGMMIPNFVRRRAAQTAASGKYGDLARAGFKAGGTLANKAGGAVLTAADVVHDVGVKASNAYGAAKAAVKGSKAGKALSWVGKGVDFVTDHIPIVKSIKKFGKGAAAVGKGAATVGRGLTGLAQKGAGFLATKTKKAADRTTAKWTSTNGSKVWESLTNLLDMLTEALDKFANCGPLKQLLKDVKPSELVKKIKDFISGIFNNLKTAIKNTKTATQISEFITKFNASTAGQALKTAGAVITGVFTVASGALDAANLFMVSEDDVDIGMRTVSAIISLLVEYLPFVGPAFDLVSSVCELVGLPNFKRELAEVIYELIYKVFGLEKKGIKTIDQKQSEYEAEYQQYLKDNNLTEEDLSLTEYNDIVNQTLGSKAVNGIIGAVKSAGKAVSNWFSGIFGGNKKQDEETATAANTEGYGSGTNTSSKRYHQNKKDNMTASLRVAKEANKQSSRASLGNGGGALGYGPGGLKQDDPSYASLSLGTLPDGSPANMANSGCGPTALANAVNAAGGNANPGEVGRYARRNGMLTDGGANAKLFTEGARKYGMSGTEISGMDSLDASLDNGNPVIVSGKSMGYGPGCNSCDSLYTKAGHIVTVTGRTPDGMYTVDDGEGSSVVSPGMLQNGATHAYSMERLGGAHAMGTMASEGSTVSASGTTPTNVVKDNGTTIQHGAYYFSQNGNSYSNMNLPPYKGTIGAIGCVHTSGTMAASTITGNAIDPGTFLNQYGNAATISNLQKAGVKVTRYPANGSQSAGTVDGTQYLDTIISALKQRKMVMMYGIGNNGNMYKYGMGGSHCVLATGLDANGNIIINDPYAPNPPYGQGSTAQTAWAPTASSINPMHWAQVIETPDGKGASGQLDPNVSSGMSVSASGASGATAGATSGATAGTSGTATAGATTGATGAEGTTGAEGESESPSATNLFNAIFNSVGNIFNKVGTRVMNSVISGKSYDQVKAEEEAAEANAAANGTATGTDTSVGYGMGMDKEPDPKILASMPGNTMEEKKMAYYQQQVARKKAQEKLPKGGAYKDYPLLGRGPEDAETTISDSGDKLDQMILLLTDIRDNTGNMVSGGALGGTTKKMETGKNTNVSKEGKKSDTQRKQSAKDSAKQKLSTLNNGLNSDSLGRGNLRSTYAKIASY